MLKNVVNREIFYFLGIGGIGMSALARYFASRGHTVIGYDRSHTPLTTELEIEGLSIHYEDSVLEIPHLVKLSPREKTLVVYTPAIPQDSAELNWFKHNGYDIAKRSEVLGAITADSPTIAVAGTHGKTTTSSLVAHLLTHSGLGCNAFLGGIASNYHSNLLLDPETPLTVVEADEFDRSFLTLSPSISIITSMDADHLDIYGTEEHVKESFGLFARKLKPSGILILKESLTADARFASDRPDIQVIRYSADKECDYYASDIRVEDGRYLFTLNGPGLTLRDLTLGLPGRHNIENAVSACAAALMQGMPADALSTGLATFQGVVRRFQTLVKKPGLVYIDDYAHHPAELTACIRSARELYPDQKIIGVFQPHLFTRTRDFADEFARSLGELDEVILLPIYPAREIPIAGVDSQMLLDKISNPAKKLLEKDELLGELRTIGSGIILTMGAGDIDTLAGPLTEALK